MFGIYKIQCVVTDMVYIGSTTVSFKKRFKKHKQRLRNNYHENGYLQYAWNKYGEATFEFIEFEPLTDIDIVKTREQFWLDIFMKKGKKHCFNLSPNACGGNTIISDEIRQKQSDNIKKSYTSELIEKRRIDWENRNTISPIKDPNVYKTEKWIINHGNAMRAISKRPEWKEAMKNANKHREVSVITDKGEEFCSVSEAARVTGAKRANIRACIKGNIATSMGRKWYYKQRITEHQTIHK